MSDEKATWGFKLPERTPSLLRKAGECPHADPEWGTRHLWSEDNWKNQTHHFALCVTGCGRVRVRDDYFRRTEGYYHDPAIVWKRQKPRQASDLTLAKIAKNDRDLQDTLLKGVETLEKIDADRVLSPNPETIKPVDLNDCLLYTSPSPRDS